jgi:hypothetical protein
MPVVEGPSGQPTGHAAKAWDAKVFGFLEAEVGNREPYVPPQDRSPNTPRGGASAPPSSALAPRSFRTRRYCPKQTVPSGCWIKPEGWAAQPWHLGGQPPPGGAKRGLPRAAAKLIQPGNTRGCLSESGPQSRAARPPWGRSARSRTGCELAEEWRQDRVSARRPAGPVRPVWRSPEGAVRIRSPGGISTWRYTTRMRWFG